MWKKTSKGNLDFFVREMFLCVVIAAAVEWECNSGDLLTIEFGGDGITVPDNCIADIGVSTMEGAELRRVGECL